MPSLEPTPEESKKRVLVPRRDIIPDVEGSKPALKKFSKWNQRIMADPYPQSNHAPVGTVDHKKAGRSPLYINEKDEYDLLHPHAQRDNQPHPFFDSNTGKLRVQNRTAFHRQHYVTIERTLPVPEVQSNGLSHAKSLNCSDIPGATPRGCY